MICTTDNAAVLEVYLQQFGITAREEQLMRLLRHLDLVVEKNKVINLTRITEAQDAIVRHVVDSLLLLPTMRRLGIDGTTRFLDIGTGAGFPGIPLGIMTESQGVLIDSVGKKTKAVNEFIAELDIADRLVAESVRAEDLARSAKGTFDYVVARAVAELPVLVEYASPLLKKQGHLVVSKANISDDEINRGEETARIVGLEVVSRETYELPNNAGHREILTLIRNRKSRVKLPRATGMAKHKPLV